MISPRAGFSAIGNSAWRTGLLVMLAGLAGLPLGCGWRGGSMLYFLGVGKENEDVPPRFKLTDEPVLILVDDRGLVEAPAFIAQVVDSTGQDLLEHRAAQRIVPDETLQRVRRSEPDFEQRGVREIGELAGAHQVIWLQVEDYAVSLQPFDPERAAVVTVSVKVIDAKTTDRQSVRLWPDNPAGHVVTAQVSLSEANQLDNVSMVQKLLAHKLGEKVAKLFYRHTLSRVEQARPT